MADRPVEGTGGQGRQEKFVFKPFAQTLGGKILQDFKDGLAKIITENGIKEPIPSKLTPEQRYAWESVLRIQKVVLAVENDLLPKVDGGKSIGFLDLPGLFMTGRSITAPFEFFDNPAQLACKDFPLTKILTSVPKNLALAEQKEQVKQAIAQELKKRWDKLEGVPEIKARQLNAFLQEVNAAIDSAESFDALDEQLAGRKYRDQKNQEQRGAAVLNSDYMRSKAFVVLDPITRQLSELLLAQIIAAQNIPNDQRAAALAFVDLKNALSPPGTPYSAADQATGILTLKGGSTVNAFDEIKTTAIHRLVVFTQALHRYWEATSLESFVDNEIAMLSPLMTPINKVISDAKAEISKDSLDSLPVIDEKLAALAKDKESMLVFKELIETKKQDFHQKTIKQLIPDHSPAHGDLLLPEVIPDSGGDLAISIRKRLIRVTDQYLSAIQQANTAIAEREKQLKLMRDDLIKQKDAATVNQYQERQTALLQDLRFPHDLIARPITIGSKIQDISLADLDAAERNLADREQDLALEQRELTLALTEIQTNIPRTLEHELQQHQALSADGSKTLAAAHSNGVKQVKDIETKLLQRQAELSIAARQLEQKRAQVATAQKMAKLLEQNNPAEWPKTRDALAQQGSELAQRLVRDQAQLASMTADLHTAEEHAASAASAWATNQSERSILDREISTQAAEVARMEAMQAEQVAIARDTQTQMLQLGERLHITPDATAELLADAKEKGPGTESLRLIKTRLEIARSLINLAKTEKEFNTETFRTLQKQGVFELLFKHDSKAKKEWEGFLSSYYNLSGYFIKAEILIAKREQLAATIAAHLQTVDQTISDIDSYNQHRATVISSKHLLETMEQPLSSATTRLAATRTLYAELTTQAPALEAAHTRASKDAQRLTTQHAELAAHIEQQKREQQVVHAEHAKLEKKIALDGTLTTLETQVAQIQIQFDRAWQNPTDLLPEAVNPRLVAELKIDLESYSDVLDETTRSLFEQRIITLEQKIVTLNEKIDQTPILRLLQENLTMAADAMSVSLETLRSNGPKEADLDFTPTYETISHDLAEIERRVSPLADAQALLDTIKAMKAEIAQQRVAAKAYDDELQLRRDDQKWLNRFTTLKEQIDGHIAFSNDLNQRLQTDLLFPLESQDSFKIMVDSLLATQAALDAQLVEVMTQQQQLSTRFAEKGLRPITPVAVEAIPALQQQLVLSTAFTQQVVARQQKLIEYAQARQRIVSGTAEPAVKGYIDLAKEYIVARAKRFPRKDAFSSGDRAAREAYVDNDLIPALREFEQSGNPNRLNRIIADGKQRFPGKVFIATVLDPLSKAVEAAVLAAKPTEPAVALALAQALAPAPDVIIPPEYLATIKKDAAAPPKAAPWYSRLWNFLTSPFRSKTSVEAGTLPGVQGGSPYELLNQNPTYSPANPEIDRRLFEGFTSTPSAQPTPAAALTPAATSDRSEHIATPASVTPSALPKSPDPK